MAIIYPIIAEEWPDSGEHEVLHNVATGQIIPVGTVLALGDTVMKDSAKYAHKTLTLTALQAGELSRGNLKLNPAGVPVSAGPRTYTGMKPPQGPP